MAENPSEIPEAVAVRRSRRTVQLVWLIPLVAALVGGWLAIQAVLERGPVITISFKTAEGLEAGKTKIKYKDVDIGLVTKVELAPDLSQVIVTAELVKGAEAQAVKDTQFWVVRPRISGGSVFGLSTLLSGAYIGVGVGKSTEAQREFSGLEAPPIFATDAPGREFTLHSNDLGSLDYGSPVFFRRLRVGQVAGYELDKDGKGVTLRVFVNAPYDQYVITNTRFWHASGVDVTLDADGIRVDTQSAVSIMLGGLAFEAPDTPEVFPPAEANATFELFASRDAAMRHPDKIVNNYRMVFNESVRGLAPGAPIDFRGVVIGEVVSINTQFDAAKGTFSIPVNIKLFPERFVSRAVSGAKSGRVARDPRAMADLLASRGARGQLRTGNLLTGQLYIALDFFPDAAPARINWNTAPPEFPTTAGSLEDLRTSLTRIAKKIDKVDFAAISTDVQQTLKDTQQTLKDLQQTLHGATRLMQKVDADLGTLTPEMRALMIDARRTLVAADRALASDSPLLQDARVMMTEIARAAQALRVLADYLERHPEALLSGKKEEMK